ncbi:MAG: tetratricopeptide repeat protein [Verrucomicrobia bacterium]|jgi:Flp pilus assembly protein TadD|nr:tetratricopeptide repeat protein [Verrucomicrobiota bacterium]
MNRIWVPLLGLLLLGVGAWGAGPGEDYVRVYSLVQQAETMERSGRTAEALAAYLDAQQGLTRIKRANPEWNPKVVDFRLRYLGARIAALTPAATPEPTPSSPPAASGVPVAPAPTPQASDAEWRQLRQDLERLQSDNSALQAKLKEALAVRPAALDPGELEKSEERNRALAKQVDLLQSQLNEAQSQSDAAPDAAALKQARQSLEAEARRADRLAAERDALASQLTAMNQTVEAGEALRQENTLLKQQLSELKSTAARQPGPTADQSKQALTQLAILRSEADILRLEKAALEQRMKTWQSRAATPTGGTASELAASRQRVGELERQLGQVQMQLSQANRDLADRSLAVVGEPNGLAQAEVDRLKARLAAYEAEKAPYSPEELVLFRMSRGLESSQVMKPAPPTGVGPLVAQAERQFKQREFSQAESTLKEILRADATNAFTLANLAATQMEQGKDAEAEVNLRKALASAPRDAFTLATMGILKFRQRQYEDALDYLGLAAQYNPDSAAIQNYLGMTLSEQGMRGPAETALRRAIQLQPGFSDAHFNLALVYTLQDPPLRELARWHYQKALAGGHPRSTEMEQLLDRRGTQ